MAPKVIARPDTLLDSFPKPSYSSDNAAPAYNPLFSAVLVAKSAAFAVSAALAAKHIVQVRKLKIELNFTL